MIARQISCKEKKINGALAEYKRILTELSLSNTGLITRGQRIMLPFRLKDKAIKCAHAGHPSINSIKRHLRSKCFFRNMDSLIEDLVRSCHACNVNTNKTNYEPIVPTTLPERSWSILDIDFSSRTPTGEYLMVAVCERSRYPVLQ